MSNLSEITVAILAGGQGTRLKSLLPGQQKVIAKVKEHPFLEYILIQLNNSGFKNVVLCTGHLGNQIQEVFGNNYQNLALLYSREVSALDTAGAVRFALPHLESEDILIMNGDSFYDCDLQSAYDFHLKKGANGTIILTEVDNTSRYGKIELNENDNIVSFEEKAKSKGVGLVNAGIYFIRKSLLLEIPKENAISFENEIFPSWIGKGLYGFETKGRFIDIGTPEAYKKAGEFFSQNPR